MQKELLVGRRFEIQEKDSNTLDFIFHLNSSGFNYYKPNSILINIYTKEGVEFYSGSLWNLFVFQQYFVGQFKNILGILRRLSSWTFTASYYNVGNYEYVRIQYPVGSRIEINVVESPFTRYYLDSHVNSYYMKNEVGDSSLKRIHKKDFPGSRLNVDKFQFLLYCPNYFADLSGVLNGGYPWQSACECLNDKFIGGLSEDFAFRTDLSFSAISTPGGQIPYTIYRDMEGVTLQRSMAGNSPAMKKMSYLVFYIV